MVKSWAMRSLLALSALSTARAACDALDNYLNVPSPLTEDTTITLSVGVIECPPLDANTNELEVEEIVIEGGTLTIKSDSPVQFINVAFKILPGAALVFDMPETLFGPNDASTEDFAGGTLLGVRDDASLTFNGDVTIQEVENVGSVLRNVGGIEFKKTVLIENNINAIPKNTGTIKFGGDTTIKGNDGIGIDNTDGGFVRFSASATFDFNGRQLEGFRGCNIINDPTSKISFRGDATFINTTCRNSEGVSVFNNGIMTFYGKALFNDNVSDVNGGAVRNERGSMTFRKAVQFNNNEAQNIGGGISVEGGDVTFRGAVQFNNNDAREVGGGIAVEGGDVTFRKAVTFSGNAAESGGAFAVLARRDFRTGEVIDPGFGSLTFKKPSAVSFEGNTVDGDNCTVGEVEEGATLIGFPGDDVCVAAT